MKNNVVQKLPIENDIKRKIKKESETRRRQAKPKPYYSHKK